MAYQTRRRRADRGLAGHYASPCAWGMTANGLKIRRMPQAILAHVLASLVHGYLPRCVFAQGLALAQKRWLAGVEVVGEEFASVVGGDDDNSVKGWPCR